MAVKCYVAEWLSLHRQCMLWLCQQVYLFGNFRGRPRMHLACQMSRVRGSLPVLSHCFTYNHAHWCITVISSSCVPPVSTDLHFTCLWYVIMYNIIFNVSNLVSANRVYSLIDTDYVKKSYQIYEYWDVQYIHQFPKCLQLGIEALNHPTWQVQILLVDQHRFSIVYIDQLIKYVQNGNIN